MLSLFDELFTIEGRYVKLEALTLEHVSEVTQIALDASVWRYSLKSIKQLDAAGVEHYLRNLLQERSVRFSLPFLIRNRTTSEALGVAKYENITPRHERMDIGHVWIGPPHDASPWLARTFFDLTDYAFGEQDVMRLGCLIDSQNAILRQAAERVGFQLDGVLRYYFMYPDGRFGDFASYSLLADEWTSIKPGLKSL